MFDCRKALRIAYLAATAIGIQGMAVAQAPLSGQLSPAPNQVLEITPSLVPEVNDGTYVLDNFEKKSNAYPKGDFAAQVSAASGNCCGACDWGWGCGGSPFRTGPGQCDNWRVGPVWKVEVDGLIFFHEDTDIDALVARSNTLAGPPPLDPLYTENFGEGPGVRISATSYWPQCKGYEVNVTYTGIPEYNASAVFPKTAVLLPPPDPGEPVQVGSEQRLLTYRTGFHSLELNVLPFNDSPWKRFLGIRYFLVDEDIDDSTDEFGLPPIAVGDVLELRDMLRSTIVENHLIGFQGGVRRDMWRFRPWLFVEGFANAGIYCNVIKREDVHQESAFRQEVVEDTEIVNGMPVVVGQEIQTTFNEIRSVVKTNRTLMALAGEAEIAVVCKLNRCLAVRSGYQALVIDGVELADDAFINFDSNPDRETRFYHGFFGGLEYRR